MNLEVEDFMGPRLRKDDIGVDSRLRKNDNSKEINRNLVAGVTEIN